MQTSSVLIVIFAMPTHCCVPECNQKGVKSLTGEKVSFFEFPNQSSLRKRWIHTIRRDEGKNWQITRDTKVCSLHFRREDLRKLLAGRTYLVDGCVPSRFAWSIPSPRKRKAPTERLPLPIPLSSKKRLFTSDTSSEINIASSAVESSNEIFPSTSGGNETNEPDISVEKRLLTSDTSSEINIASSAVESSNEIFPSTSGGNETNEPDISVEKRLLTSDTSSEINIASSAVESSNEIFPSTSGGNETNEPDISVEKRLLTSDTSSEINIASSAVESSTEIFPSTSGGNETDEPDISVESNVEMDQGKKVEDLEARLLQSEKEELERKIIENEQHQETLSSRLFSLDRFKSNADVNFYTGLPNYATLISIFEFLNPGEDCENIRSRISSDVPEEFYNSESDDEEDTSTTKRGRCRKLKPLEEFFIVLCRSRRGFSERHLANL